MNIISCCEAMVLNTNDRDVLGDVLQMSRTVTDLPRFRFSYGELSIRKCSHVLCIGLYIFMTLFKAIMQ